MARVAEGPRLEPIRSLLPSVRPRSSWRLGPAGACGHWPCGPSSEIQTAGGWGQAGPRLLCTPKRKSYKEVYFRLKQERV